MNESDHTGGLPDFSDPSQLRDHLEQLFSDPTLLPDTFKSWLPNHLSVNPPDITVEQITGFQQYTSTDAPVINAEESTTSVGTYVDLATTANISGLSDGLYQLTYGAAAKVSAGTTRAKMNISINGAAPDDTKTPQAYTSNTGGMAGISATCTLRLSGGVSGNTIKAMYCVAATATGTFGSRYLSAVRISS